MSFTRNAGRFAGLLYILASIPGVFALVYVPGKLIVRGNATATAHNIVVSEMLFRLGIAADLICQALFIFVALALYDVLKGVNRGHALLMVTLILVSIPIALLNELNGIAALIRRSGMYGPPSQLMTNRQGTHRASYKLNTSALLPRHGLSLSNLNSCLLTIWSVRKEPKR